MILSDQKLAVKYHLLLLFASAFCYTMEPKEFAYSCYYGTPITPETLLTLAPEMPSTLKEQTDEWIENNKKFIKALISTPSPLTHESRKQKTINNLKLIKQYEEEKN